MNNVGLYARVSTNDGRQDTEVQLRPLRDYCHRRQLHIAEEYVDRMSGSHNERPAFARLMADARQRKIDVVLVWKFDRFARSTRALVLALEEFLHLGIDFISYSEQIDTASPMGKAMFTMISAIAEFERSLITERVRAGLQRARDKGVALGRPRKGFDVSAALSLRKQGTSWNHMARILKVSSSTLRRALYPLLKNHGAQDAPVPAQ
jgi:DNA invertase Pin-like site-specific DNA recombinase